MRERGDGLENFSYGVRRFLDGQKIVNIEKINSRWRTENLILKITTSDKVYVCKKINREEKFEEIKRVNLIRKEYQTIFPDVYIIEKDNYLMDFIDGKTFFELEDKEKPKKIEIAAEKLKSLWCQKEYDTKNIREKVKGSFTKYRKKSSKYFDQKELTEVDLKCFEKVPKIVSHNDLNAANLIYTEEDIKIIDPSEEGYEDIARDIGRYCASTFFNQYDYFGNNKKFSLEIAEKFLSSFNVTHLERARYYIGESFLSFLNFETISTPKSILKNLCINVLTSDKPIIKCLEDSI